MGVAFSIGFVFGPSIGAMFSLMDKDSEKFYILPALFCIVLAVADILFLYAFLPETLPARARVGSVCVHARTRACVRVCVFVYVCVIICLVLLLLSQDNKCYHDLNLKRD